MCFLLLLTSPVLSAPVAVEWTVVDVAAQRSVTVPDDAAKLTAGGALGATPEGLGLRLDVQYRELMPMPQRANEHSARIVVHLTDLSGQDRGLVVRLSLLLPPDNWSWEEDLDSVVPLTEKSLSNTTALRELPGLPEFPGGERPDYGRYSAYPVGCVERRLGETIALARPMDQLALVRFAAQGGAMPRLTAEVDLALSEYTDPPREATFELLFLTTRTRPGCGMRHALPLAHAGSRLQTNRPLGGWMPFANLAGIRNVDEFGFGFQEGAPNPKFDDALGVASFVYFHCACEFANVEGYKRGTEPLPPYEAVMAALNRVAQQNSGVEGVWDVCGIQGPDGKVAYRPERTYGDFFCQACVDPSLPYGKAMADRLVARVTAAPYREGVDGCYYDGIAAGLDYAPDHLRAADHLLLWDGKLNRPVNYNLWSSVDWARSIHGRFAGTGKLTMLNDSSLASFNFAGPYIDVPGAEMDLNLRRDQCRLIRSLLMSAPFCTLVKADFTQVTQAQIETYMRRCVAYGILFGFFDISPSGDHPGSSYWEHPEWYDRDRGLFRRYMPLARELLAAGWQPVPLATVGSEGAFAESFGSPEAPLQYVAVSTDPEPDLTQTRGDIITFAEGRAPELAVELLTGRIERAQGEVHTEVGGEDLQVWAFGPPEAQGAACLARARDVLDRRERYIGALRLGGESLAPWSAYMEFGARLASSGRNSRTCLLAEKTAAGSAGATQTVAVNHTRPQKLIVSGWSKAENVTGAKDRDYALYVDCYYTDGTAIYGQTVDFDPGTHDWQYGERTIEPEKPVRNINVYLLFRGNHTGQVWFDDVRVALADSPDTNLLRRGDFEHEAGLSRLADDTPEAARLNDALAALAQLTPADLRGPKVDEGLAAAEEAVAATQWGADAGRSRRDLEDLRWHLKLAQACLAGRPTPASRASRLTEPVALGAPRVSTGPRQYEAHTGAVPAGTLVLVDSNYEGYSPYPLTDGKVNPPNVHWTQVAWASEEGADGHWIELRFPQPVTAREVRVYGALDAGTLHVPQLLGLQMPEGNGWMPIAAQKAQPGPDGLVTLTFPPQQLTALRVHQAPHGGSAARRDLMWISEVEVR